MAAWDPDIYARYQSFRDRPALDLMLRLPEGFTPRRVWDLGCGAGEHAALFARRWPGAAVTGLDLSPEMLARARARPEAVTWTLGDLLAFQPAEPVDLIFSNAAVQWVEGQADLLQRWARALAPGGVLAVQAPLSYDAPQTRIVRDMALEEQWSAALTGVQAVRRLDPPERIYDALAALCDPIDLWTTTYWQDLRGQDPVVDWMLGTGLRPFVEAVEEPRRQAFLEAYRDRVAVAFPRRSDGVTLLPFERLFVVARRTG